MIVEYVFNIKGRGTVIQVHDKEQQPVVGDTYSCGDDSWKIRSVEKGNCMCGEHGPYFLILLKQIKGRDEPEVGCVLSKVGE